MAKKLIIIIACALVLAVLGISIGIDFTSWKNLVNMLAWCIYGSFIPDILKIK